MAVIRSVSNVLIHAPNLLCHNGSTQVGERLKDAGGPYFEALRRGLRSFDAAVSYVPNQAYIGNIGLDDLHHFQRPWYEIPAPDAAREGRFGEIMPEEEFYGLLKMADVFQLVMLEQKFTADIAGRFKARGFWPETLLSKLGEGVLSGEIEGLVSEKTAEGLYLGDRLVGCVRQCHDTDENLSSHIMLENLTCKASALLAARHLIRNQPGLAEEIGYIIECSEEACGDVNQRGGGNFAKSIGELAGFTGATGSDIRGFCAGPVHALLHAASLVDAGVFANVAVVAGGSAAKLGMNARDHVKKGIPVLEDMLGAFAVLISADNGRDPVIRTDVIGRHTIGTGSAPQQVMKALVSAPLSRLDRSICDIDRYAGELQNPEITESAGAGNVPEANYKMIAALAVMNGELTRQDIPAFTSAHGFCGFAPTQGHIPSGVPALGYLREKMLAGDYAHAMLIGKGSLFLGRMTNLFDGLSLIVERNTGAGKTAFQPAKIKIGITIPGSEHGDTVVLNGALEAARKDGQLEVITIGGQGVDGLPHIPAQGEDEAHRRMDELLASGKLDAAVTMHYTFPLGTSTVGLVDSPASGKPMFVACTTGTTAVGRVESMVRNALCGVAAAQAYGIEHPRIGVLNVDGALQVQRALLRLKENGCPLTFADSVRGGGANMRGNDLICCTPDVMVCDSLTGNLVMKLFSAFTSGGAYETRGFGYGPGIGAGGSSYVHIVSRSSGSPVIANAILYAAAMVRGSLSEKAACIFRLAGQAGLSELYPPSAKTADTEEMPARKPVDEEITGVDVFELEQARDLLLHRGIYTEIGMGCVGPVVLAAREDVSRAKDLLRSAGLIS